MGFQSYQMANDDYAPPYSKSAWFGGTTWSNMLWKDGHAEQSSFYCPSDAYGNANLSSDLKGAHLSYGYAYDGGAIDGVNYCCVGGWHYDTPTKVTKAKAPSSVFVAMDARSCDPAHLAQLRGFYIVARNKKDGTANMGTPHNRHNSYVNMLHLDGHVSSYRTAFDDPLNNGEIGTDLTNPRGWYWNYDK